MFANTRPSGVVSTRIQGPTNAVAPNEVVGALPLEMVAVSIGDNEGRQVMTVAVRVEGQGWFFPPNGQEWASQLRPATAKVSAKLEEIRAGRQAGVPTTDKVNILPKK